MAQPVDYGRANATGGKGGTGGLAGLFGFGGTGGTGRRCNEHEHYPFLYAAQRQLQAAKAVRAAAAEPSVSPVAAAPAAQPMEKELAT